jgi:hypothetical protein
MKSIPKEYLTISEKIKAVGKQYLFLYNFGPIKFLTIDEINSNDDLLTDFHSNNNFYGFDFLPFAIVGRYNGVLLYGSTVENKKGVFYNGTYPKTRYPIKISDDISEIIPLEILNDNLISEEEIYAYEEKQYNNYGISLTTDKGIIPTNKDVRILFQEKFTKSILMNKESDYKDLISKFLILNKIEFADLPDGRYYSSDFEEISKKIRKNYSINFYHTHFIPSDYYAIGIYSSQEMSELLKLGLLSDEELNIDEEVYRQTI